MRRRSFAVLAAAAAVGASALTGAPAANAASSSHPMVLGAVGANATEIASHDRALGVRMQGVRVFKKWDSTLFSSAHRTAGAQGRALFVSIKAERTRGSIVSFRSIGSASPGSPLYRDMQRQASQIKSYGRKVFIIFNHEPEVKFSRANGGGADFIAAWRKVISVYRASGVRNAEYVWTVSGHSFSRSDVYSASRYYPGDDYVDHIGADVYNWYNCRGDGGRWATMAGLLEGHRRFGAAHPRKGLVVPEWASVEDRANPTRKAAFIRETQALFKRPGWGQYKAVLTWGGRSDNGRNICRFDYTTSSASLAAMRRMAQDSAYRGTSAVL